MSPKASIQALEALVNSKGWQVIRTTMEAEIVEAAMAIANQAAMSQQEVDFRRGSIWAARQLLQLPERLKVQFETELALSTGTDDSGKAPPLK